MRTLLFCSLAIVLFAGLAFTAPRPNAGLIPDDPLMPAETDSGGPDLWGYTWKDSNDPGGPPFAWKDLSSVGTPVTGLGDDNYVGPFPIGFSFHYYWYNVTQYWIESNGYLEFSPPLGGGFPFPNIIPLTTPPNDFLAPYMADFDMSVGGQCRRWNNADSCVISWTNIPAWNTGGSHTFQIILSRLDSNITFQYGSQQGLVGGNDILVGIENVNGTMGLMYSHDVYPLPNNAIKWYHPVNPYAIVHDLAASAAGNDRSEGFFVLSGNSIIPMGKVKNVGNVTENNYQVNCTLQLVGGAVVYNQTQTITTTLAPNAEQIINFTPSWTASATGTYFFKITVTMVGDMYPYNNLKTTEMHGFTPPGTLFYDDGTAEGSWDWQRDNEILANHFVPPVYPAFIDSVRYYVVTGGSPTSSLIAQVLDDDGPEGGPGTLLWWSTINTPNANQWVGAILNVLIQSGGFYVAWIMSDSMARPLGLDHTLTQPVSRQGWEFDSTWSKWHESETGDLMIRTSIHTIAAPALDVNLLPLNPPIIIPANGGSFSFNVSVVNTYSPQAPFYVWIRDRWPYPEPIYTPIQLGPVLINPPLGLLVTRLRVQNVPGSWPPGVHTFLGYVNTSVTYPAIDSSFFTWTKLTTGTDSPWITEATCTGEPFPGETISTQPSTFSLLGVSPNPFNPSTAISFKLQATSQVSLKVYDAAGRLVTTLVDGWREAGSHKVTFDCSRLASGLYFVQLNVSASGSGTTPTTAVQKMMLLK